MCQKVFVQKKKKEEIRDFQKENKKKNMNVSKGFCPKKKKEEIRDFQKENKKKNLVPCQCHDNP